MKIDPTRTLTLRDNFARRLKQVYRKRVKAIIDALPLVYKGDAAASITLKIDDVNAIIEAQFNEGFQHEVWTIIELNIPLAYRAGFKRAIKELKKAGIDITDYEYTIRDLEAIKVLNENGFTLCKTLGEDAKKEAKRIISEYYLRGSSIAEMRRELMKKVGGMTKHRAEMIARTETIRAYNTAAVNQYGRWGVKKWVWITAFDERTCDICANLDGQVFDLDAPRPPAHPLCRCSASPWVY